MTTLLLFSQVVFFLLSSYAILQEALSYKLFRITELCDNKETIEVSTTYSLITKLLWNYDDGQINEPEEGSELYITFYHKLYLSPFLRNLIRNGTSNIEIRDGIWMKVRFSDRLIDAGGKRENFSNRVQLITRNIISKIFFILHSSFHKCK